MLDYILLLNVLIDDYKYVFLDLLYIRTHQCFQFKITLWSIILGDWVLGHEMYAGWSWIRRILLRLTSSDRNEISSCLTFCVLVFCYMQISSYFFWPSSMKLRWRIIPLLSVLMHTCNLSTQKAELKDKKKTLKNQLK